MPTLVCSSRYIFSTGCLHIGHKSGREALVVMMISSDLMGTTSWLKSRTESSREDRGEETVVGASRDVGGAVESRTVDGGTLICILDKPSLSVAVLRAFWKLDEINALFSVSTGDCFADAEDLVDRVGSNSSGLMGVALDFVTFLGDGRRGCLKLFGEL